MRLQQLRLKAFGPFTDRVLDFGTGGPSLVLVYGPNEAGKSATLRAISDLRFGIPDRSVDRFVHDYADMRIGGVFVDSQGLRHSLMRRKGRSGSNLTYYDFDEGRTDDARPVTADVEALLTGGLSRSDYELMFGLTHAKLREGGASLAKGEGDIGVALYEASAGVRSIKTIIERLDSRAREFFMPGARGKNAIINESLRMYEAHNASYRGAAVRPQVWVDLRRTHEEAQTELAWIERELASHRGRLLLAKELRAVGPLLSSLHQARQVLASLAGASLLPASSAAERSVASAALAAANQAADQAAARVRRYQDEIERLQPDEAVLRSAPAIRRLIAQAETIGTLQLDLAAARRDMTSAERDFQEISLRIDPKSSPDELLERAPTGVLKVQIEEALREQEQCAALAEQNRESLDGLTKDTHEVDSDDAPSVEVRLTLASAMAEVMRIDSVLRRLEALPSEVLEAQRTLHAGLRAIGVPDESSLQRISPLLGAEIDVAVRRVAEAADLRRALEDDVDKEARMLEAETDRRDGLRAGGAVMTTADVQVARAHREVGWRLVRAALADPAILGSEPAIAFGTGQDLPLAYEAAVSRADAVVDDVARDTKRATELLACVNSVQRLEASLAQHRARREALQAEENQRQAEWLARLRAAGLPALGPGELREWQDKLAAARQAEQDLRAKLDEQRLARDSEGEVMAQLRAAIIATGMATPASGATLRSLASLGSGIEERVRSLDTQAAQAAGQRKERASQRQALERKKLELEEKMQAARGVMEPFLHSLLLPGDASTAAARARLEEFDCLVVAKSAVSAAKFAERRSCDGLAAIEQQAAAVEAAVGGTRFADLRLYIDALGDRLEQASRCDTERKQAIQSRDAAAASEREHREKAEAHQKELDRLCAIANVSTVAELTQAEVLSQRRRDAQAELERASGQLAQASRRSEQELEELLGANDLVQMDADEAKLNHDISVLDGSLPGARAREEADRRALEGIDSSGAAATARESMESAAASVRANISPWVRSRLAHGLLSEALKRFRDRAQGPMLTSASALFRRMTDGDFVGLSSDDVDGNPVLMAQRHDGKRIAPDAMSEGTRDQLYLALRLAAIELRRSSGTDLPVTLDDVLMTSDDRRATLMVQALADFAGGSQVIVFTHHQHLLDLARAAVPADALLTVML